MDTSTENFDIDESMRAFRASQDRGFREQLALWLHDESISDEEFARKVTDLDFSLASSRLYFFSYLRSEREARVDESQAGDVE